MNRSRLVFFLAFGTTNDEGVEMPLFLMSLWRGMLGETNRRWRSLAKKSGQPNRLSIGCRRHVRTEEMLAATDAIIEALRKHFPGQRAHRNVRLPESGHPQASLTVRAVFTSDGTRPRWDNLGVVVHEVDGDDDSIETWRHRFGQWPIRAALLVANDNRTLLVRQGDSDEVDLHSLPSNDRFESELSRFASRFSPRNLRRYRQGQLSFVDLESTVSPKVLGFAARHREHLHDALHAAIQAAIEAVPRQRRKELGKTVIDLALAYLAARVLEDKGFLSHGEENAVLVNDPRKLLRLTQAKTNGFFRKAYREKLPAVRDIPELLEALAAHLGPTTTFALVNHHDVGLLYEWLLEELRSGAFHIENDNRRKSRVEAEHVPSDLAALQQHYTPMALTTRILERLPLERIRPEQRYIFDPTAGSGSFLLAGTQRLAAMTDIEGDRRVYLSEHVIGNDIDSFAKDITFVRYCLVQQAELNEDLFPRPETFMGERYEDLKRESLKFRPTVLVANPPYAQKGGVQEAATFVEKMLEWLEDGAQFGLVLPTSFLTQDWRGVKSARALLSKRGRILEVWQCPPGAVGLSARQETCVVLGIVGKSELMPTMARAVISEGESKSVREEGLLGASWIAELPDVSGDWTAVNMPTVKFDESTIPLGQLFHVFTGPTPAAGETQTMTSKPQTGNARAYFRLRWVGKDRIWADPRSRPDEFYINDWRFTAERNRSRLAEPKLIVHNSMSRNAENPLQFCYDDHGYWPDQNTHCIAARAEPQGTSLLEWLRLSMQERVLWLAGIFASTLAREVFTTLRGSRHSGIHSLENFPLPSRIDRQIIDLMLQVLEEEKQSNLLETEESPLLARMDELEKLVQHSYGRLNMVSIARTSRDPAIERVRAARREKSVAIVGQVVDVDALTGDRILLYLGGLRDEIREHWVALPYELPGWALDGTTFVAKIPRRIKTFAELENDRGALRDFQHPPRAYEDIDVLADRLTLLEAP